MRPDAPQLGWIYRAEVRSLVRQRFSCPQTAVWRSPPSVSGNPAGDEFPDKLIVGRVCGQTDARLLGVVSRQVGTAGSGPGTPKDDQDTNVRSFTPTTRSGHSAIGPLKPMSGLAAKCPSRPFIGDEAFPKSGHTAALEPPHTWGMSPALPRTRPYRADGAGCLPGRSVDGYRPSAGPINPAQKIRRGLREPWPSGARPPRRVDDLGPRADTISRQQLGSWRSCRQLCSAPPPDRSSRRRGPVPTAARRAGVADRRARLPVGDRPPGCAAAGSADPTSVPRGCRRASGPAATRARRDAAATG